MRQLKIWGNPLKETFIIGTEHTNESECRSISWINFFYKSKGWITFFLKDKGFILKILKEKGNVNMVPNAPTSCTPTLSKKIISTEDRK